MATSPRAPCGALPLPARQGGARNCATSKPLPCLAGKGFGDGVRRDPAAHLVCRLLPGSRASARRLPVLLLALLLLPLLGACSEVAYYWQAGLGQWEILNKRRPIAEVLADPAVDAEIKRKLRLVEAVQAFASERLALPSDGHYTTYADLGRPTVTWLVVAAPALSLEAHRFCYLLVGCLEYRGYFARADAEALADRLRGEGQRAARRAG